MSREAKLKIKYMYNPKSKKWLLDSGGSIDLLSMRITRKHI